MDSKKDINLEDVKKRIIEEELEELGKAVEDLKAVLPKPAKITKEEFEKFFLPYFLGEVERNEVNTQVFIYNYLEKTDQSYHREIEVVDKNGDILYILPPLFIDIGIKKGDVSVSFLTRKMTALMESGYYNTDKELVKGLNEILKSLGTDEDRYKKYIIEYNRIVLDYKDRFINAYKRKYGIPVEEAKEESRKIEKKETKTLMNNISEEDDIFDY